MRREPLFPDETEKSISVEPRGLRPVSLWTAAVTHFHWSSESAHKPQQILSLSPWWPGSYTSCMLDSLILFSSAGSALWGFPLSGMVENLCFKGSRRRPSSTSRCSAQLTRSLMNWIFDIPVLASVTNVHAVSWRSSFYPPSSCRVLFATCLSRFGFENSVFPNPSKVDVQTWKQHDINL